MIYIRKLLLKIRQINSITTDKQKALSFLVWLLFIVIGVIIDLFVPFNYFTNILRAFIAVLNGFYLFSVAYIYIQFREKRKREKNDASEDVVGDRFSYSQRLNLSIFLWGIFVVFALLGSTQNKFFTLFSAILVTFALSILTFMRSTRSETLGASIGLRDPRDVLFEKQVEEELALRAAYEEKTKTDKD